MHSGWSCQCCCREAWPRSGNSHGSGSENSASGHFIFVAHAEWSALIWHVLRWTRCARACCLMPSRDNTEPTAGACEGDLSLCAISRPSASLMLGVFVHGGLQRRDGNSTVLERRDVACGQQMASTASLCTVPVAHCLGRHRSHVPCGEVAREASYCTTTCVLDPLETRGKQPKRRAAAVHG